MFEPFTQQSADKTGLGLGLSITKKIVETYQGVLSVKNRPGVGCIFTIDLPGYTDIQRSCQNCSTVKTPDD
jgi:signal transduction histidine kinase